MKIDQNSSPSEKTSTGKEYVKLASPVSGISGDVHPWVPTFLVISSVLEQASVRARPRSAIFIVKSLQLPVTNMLAGFKSR